MNKKAKKWMLVISLVMITLFPGSLVYANTFPNHRNQDDRYSWQHREEKKMNYGHHSRGNHCRGMMYSEDIDW